MLTINEIFHSIQGESTHAGRPCVFVRLTACDLRCSWCDTPYAFHEGTKVALEDVVEQVKTYGCPTVEITGGEPLLQPDVYPLMERLVSEGYTVLLETGGHRSIADVPDRVIRIVDVKCPGSGEAEKNHWPNLDMLRAQDEIKFVIKDRTDYEWARSVVLDKGLAEMKQSGKLRELLFSPVWDAVDFQHLAEWILEDHLPVRYQIQLHKVIWGANVPGV